MKFGVQAQNPKEWIALAFNLAPVPVVHSNLYAHCARVICDVVELGVFEGIGTKARTPAEIASVTSLNERALGPVLNLLVSLGYLSHSSGKFRSTALTQKWLLQSSESHICDAIRLFRARWSMYEHLPEYLRTGVGFGGQADMPEELWPTYQKAMFQLARMGVKEFATKTHVPRGATAMLDIGGSHGLYSVELCRRVPTMRAEVLELPQALPAAAQLLASINTEKRVSHCAGNVLEDDLGTDRYDVILMANLVHIFDSEQNRAIAKKVARALKKGGRFIIHDFLRPDVASGSDTLSSVQNLFFSLLSAAGTYSLEEEQSWQRDAGLTPTKVVRFISTPLTQVVAHKKA